MARKYAITFSPSTSCSWSRTANRSYHSTGVGISGKKILWRRRSSSGARFMRRLPNVATPSDMPDVSVPAIVGKDGGKESALEVNGRCLTLDLVGSFLPKWVHGAKRPD